MCDIVGCDQRPEYYDDMDNKLCSDCMERELEEESTDRDSYQLISVVEQAIRNSSHNELEMNRIIQQNSWSCYACVAAMITGQTLKDVCEYVGHDGSYYKEDSTHPEKKAGFGHVEIWKYLLEYGYTVGTYSIFQEPSNIDGYDEIQFSIKIGECRAILQVVSKMLPNCTHIIYWDGKTIFDPSPSAEKSPSLSDYQVLKFIPVFRFD